ncbi:Crp/Fnr family transcriptional regulator [Chitinophaga horti]|uniref:Crp/Fnr family transcriptional regulator n=1 Tax=Chitinophaga horti TaxID=2920382 RepID=A0ABY6J1V3_9BACT|nr:Crp/Fnr family transcriptional regulator [Chitinophaga horti]UYQ93376.1 Crp/Fnr family transcriptional regulator [Chitinophaga horti]
MKKDKHGCDLNTCLMCRLCLKDWLPAIEAHRTNYVLNKGQLLFSEHDAVTGIYFIYSGKMKVHKHWSKDKELIVRFAKSGDIVGHRGIGTELVYPVSATALEPTTVCYVELSFFKSTLKVNNELLYELMMFYARELQESEKKMRNLAHMSVKGRIATALSMLQEKFGTNKEGHINLQLSRQDLASYTGTTYETAFRMMNELINDNAVEVSGKNIRIINQEKLHKLSQEHMEE